LGQNERQPQWELVETDWQPGNQKTHLEHSPCIFFETDVTVLPVYPDDRPLLPSPVSLLTALLAVVVTVLAAEPIVEVRL